MPDVPVSARGARDIIISPPRKREQEMADYSTTRHGQGLRNVRNGMDYFHLRYVWTSLYARVCVCTCVHSRSELS